MADGEQEDDDEGIPVIPPGVRVHVDPDPSGPPTAEERARFNIPEPSPAAASALKRIQDRTADPRASGVDPSVITALVAKFPDFNPEWPAKTQAAWFSSFEQLMKAGLQ